MKDLDKLDFRLLYQLDRDSRISFTALANLLKIPQETVRYRVNRLIKRRVIVGFPTMINRYPLGFSFFKVFLKLRSVNEKKIGTILTHIASNSNVSWTCRFDGRFDIGFSMPGRNPRDAHDVIHEVCDAFTTNISERFFACNISFYGLSREYLAGKKTRAVSSDPEPMEYGSYAVDAVNDAILRLLSKDARMSAADIARTIKSKNYLGKSMTPEAILQRIKRLEDDHILERYSILLDNEKLGQRRYKVLIFLNRASQKATDGLVKAIRSEPRAIQLLSSLGSWDYELDVEVPGRKELREMMWGFSEQFDDLIDDFELLEVVEIAKHDYLPGKHE